MTADRRARLRARLQDQGLAAFIGMGAANFRYLTGAPSAFLELSHQLVGTDMVIVPADPRRGSILLVNEYSADEIARASDIADVRPFSNWTENRRFDQVANAAAVPFDRPEQFDLAELDGMLQRALTEVGASGRDVGVDMAAVSAPVATRLCDALQPTRLIDATASMYELRARKDGSEMANIRSAAALFDLGVTACFRAARPGMTRSDLQRCFETAIQRPDNPVSDASFFFPHIGTRGDDVLQRGDVLKIDAGARVNGYWSDGCRHAVLGPSTPQARLVHEALFAGFVAARELLRPGVSMRQIYETAMQTVRSRGLPGYSRGHVGHSIGLDNHQEEPPFIGPNDVALTEGMVLCLELPFYPPDVGGFNIEDMFLITRTGAECLTHCTRTLQELP